jgi:cytochrome c-type biogenesis protein
MEFGLGSYGFGFLAGLLSTLSPCVLPIIPILLGSATNVHPRAPLVLAAGFDLAPDFRTP